LNEPILNEPGPLLPVTFNAQVYVLVRNHCQINAQRTVCLELWRSLLKVKRNLWQGPGTRL